MGELVNTQRTCTSKEDLPAIGCDLELLVHRLLNLEREAECRSVGSETLEKTNKSRAELVTLRQLGDTTWLHIKATPTHQRRVHNSPGLSPLPLPNFKPFYLIYLAITSLDSSRHAMFPGPKDMKARLIRHVAI
jgi:hypothetical protein